MAIKENQMVSLNFEIKINEDILESNLDENPIEFKYGTGQLLEALEKRISEMNEGEKKEINIPAKDAYGEYDERLSESLPISNFDGIDLEIGMVLEADGENGEVFKATVTDVTKEEVTVDYNHPLAGCDLDFTVIIKKIV